MSGLLIQVSPVSTRRVITRVRLWLKAVTEPNSAKPTAIAEWARVESTENDGNVQFSDTGI